MSRFFSSKRHRRLVCALDKPSHLELELALLSWRFSAVNRTGQIHSVFSFALRLSHAVSFTSDKTPAMHRHAPLCMSVLLPECYPLRLSTPALQVEPLSQTSDLPLLPTKELFVHHTAFSIPSPIYSTTCISWWGSPASKIRFFPQPFPLQKCLC